MIRVKLLLHPEQRASLFENLVNYDKSKTIDEGLPIDE